MFIYVNFTKSANIMVAWWGSVTEGDLVAE